jgi:hypothetical protein
LVGCTGETMKRLNQNSLPLGRDWNTGNPESKAVSHDVSWHLMGYLGTETCARGGQDIPVTSFTSCTKCKGHMKTEDYIHKSLTKANKTATTGTETWFYLRLLGNSYPMLHKADDLTPQIAKWTTFAQKPVTRSRVENTLQVYRCNDLFFEHGSAVRSDLTKQVPVKEKWLSQPSFPPSYP